MLNSCTFLGRLAADPELRRTAAGTPCCSFRLAVDRDFKNQDGERETDWLNFVAWKGTAEFIARNFAKGKPMAVEARAQSRTYEKDGKTNYVVEFVVESAYFAGGKREESGYSINDGPLPWEE